MNNSRSNALGGFSGRSAGGVRESKIDWITILLFLTIIILGWFNLYSTSREDGTGIFDLSTYHGKEALFILIGVGAGVLILFLDTKFMEFVSYFAYAATILALIAVLAVSKVSGASSWFAIGGIKIQPTEFAKLTTVMALAKYMSRFNFSLKKRADFMVAVGIVALPMLLVILQNDAGSALVFGGLIFMFYREGLHPLYLVGLAVLALVGTASIVLSTSPQANVWLAVGIGGLTVVTFIVMFRLGIRRWRPIYSLVGAGIALMVIALVTPKVVKPHHSARLRVLFASDQERKEDKDLKRVYYNLRESLVAIGSGGVTGKGYGEGIHTRADFVPEEHTDYIFCVLGEEHGFIGVSVVLLLFLLLLARIFYVAENSKSVYARVYGYGIASIIFLHLLINVGMTIGLLPTVGIPLSFYSYGGSSMIAFTLMIFVMMNHYSYRTNILT
ncbi:MAG: rod shape-determining protein RodA [Bacteroidota bacterium]